MRRALVLLLAAAACASDEPFLDAQPGTSTGAATTTTGPLPTTTGDATTTTGDPGTTTTTTTTGDASTSDGESTAAPPEQTCRDILECVGMCALNFDLACFQMCTEGVSPDEGQKAIALGTCIAQGCFTSGSCTPETIMDIACIGCLGLGLLGGSPKGCEDEADACT